MTVSRLQVTKLIKVYEKLLEIKFMLGDLNHKVNPLQTTFKYSSHFFCCLPLFFGPRNAKRTFSYFRCCSVSQMWSAISVCEFLSYFNFVSVTSTDFGSCVTLLKRD